MCSLVLGLVLLCLAHLTSASPKKGLCIPPGENFHCGDLEAFSSVSWWYNWHTRPNHVVDGYCSCDTAPDCGPEPDKPSFIPMIWGYHTDDWWHDDIDDPVADKYHTILGFNEPNRGKYYTPQVLGADLDPEVAAAAWVEIQELYPDKILVSPAPAGGNTNWFDKFFEFCEVLNCRIDYLATHDYQGEVDKVMDKLKMLHNRYGKKIWLTEFAKCCTRDKTEVEEFVKAIIPRLEAAKYVYRYSWFITRYTHNYPPTWNTTEAGESEWYLDKVNALMKEGSSELTSVGVLYDQL